MPRRLLQILCPGSDFRRSLELAQRFSAGNRRRQNGRVPIGTEGALLLQLAVVPDGTFTLAMLEGPALKHWAIIDAVDRRQRPELMVGRAGSLLSMTTEAHSSGFDELK